MKNKPLKWKLLLSYGVIFLLVLVIGLTSISVVNMMTRQGVKYAEQIVPAVEEIGMARRNMISVRRYLLNSIIAQTSLDYERTVESMTTDREALFASLDQIGALMPQYAPDVEAIEEKLQSVSAANQEILELAGKLDDADAKNQAYVLYLDKYAVAFNEAAEMIIALNDSISQTADSQEQMVLSVRTISMVIIIAIVVCAFGAVVLFTVLMLRYILVPVKSLIRAAEIMEQGDFSQTIEVYNSKDEFGQLSRAISNSTERIVFIIRDLLVGLQAVSNGRFNVRSQDENRYLGEYCKLRDSMYQLNEMMSDTIAQIRSSADQVASGAEQVANGAQALSQGSTEQASSVQELAATLEDIAHQVRENTHSIEEVEGSVESTVSEVSQSTEKMRAMLAAMNDIADSSAQIEKIINSIEDIAFQTNILALNAAVEAARAGTAGKGFAVVADEVRRLAASTAEASKNTASLISESLQSVQNGKQIADDTAASLERVNDIIQTLAQQAKKVSQTSVAQDAAIQQTTVGVDQISAVVQNNSATAEQSAAASQELSSQAHILQSLTGRFEIEESHAG